MKQTLALNPSDSSIIMYPMGLILYDALFLMRACLSDYCVPSDTMGVMHYTIDNVLKAQSRLAIDKYVLYLVRSNISNNVSVLTLTSL